MKIDCSINAFRRIWQKYPENLFLFSLDVLKEGMEDCHEAKVAVIAELFIRVFLSSNQKSAEAQIINENLPDGELNDFMCLFLGPHFDSDSLEGELWVSGDELSSCCQAAVRRRFQRLFEADGLIPVYCGSKPYWIPFHFFDNGDMVGVYDLRKSNNEHSETEITEWSGYLKMMGITSSVMIHCSCVGGLQLTGNSLMLPLQLAWWRKQKELPEYNVFRLVSTGAFDANLCLIPVATEEKSHLFDASNGILDYKFVFPESQQVNPRGCNFETLPAGIKRDNLLMHIRKIAERMDKFDLDYALRRIDGMDKEVRMSNFSHWEILIERLEKAAVFDKHNNKQKEAYLLNLILQSEANRHCGRTKQSEILNDRAREFAAKEGDKFQKLLLLLEIEKLVDKQDREEFAEVLEYVAKEKLEEQLQALEDDDLWMRYHGTMGQAYAYGTLEKLPGFSKETALEHFEKAVEKAECIDKIAEIAHDKNYMHLFYALFEPGSIDELEAYDQAQNIINQLKKCDKDVALRNLHYLKRSQAFAWYRQLLHGTLPEYRIDVDFTRLLRNDSNGADDWIRACVGKYLGAVETAMAIESRNNGEESEAEQRQKSAEGYFRNAMDAIQDEKNPGIKTLIKVTVYAEAYRSLSDHNALEKAKELIDSLPSDFVCGSLSAWKAYLDHPDNDFPGLSYWY